MYLIVWASRREIIPEQLILLDKIFGSNKKIIQVGFVETAESFYKYLSSLKNKYDKIIVISTLPLGLIKKFLDILEEKKDNKIEVWFPKMKEVEAADPNTVAVRYGTIVKYYKFTGFEKIKKITIEAEDIDPRQYQKGEHIQWLKNTM